MLYYVSNKLLTMYVPNNILLVVVVIVKGVVYLYWNCNGSYKRQRHKTKRSGCH